MSPSTKATGGPRIVDRAIFQSELDVLRIREKAHTREGDAIAAVRRRLPMVEVDATTPLIGRGGPLTLLDAFEGRRLLIAYYFMWHAGHSAAEQCEGCSLYAAQVRELSFLHSRDVTYATFCQGPYEESVRYCDFMGWQMPWYSASRRSLETLLVGRQVGMMDSGLLPAAGIESFRDLLDDPTRRRGGGQQLSVARSDGLRTPRVMGGFAFRLAAAARRLPPLSRRRTSHSAMASSESGTLRRFEAPILTFAAKCV